MARLIGPSCEVPAMSAGGAVVEPLPSICTRTLGYSFWNPSAQKVMRLLSVSEPTEFRLPETPLVLLYAGIEESTLATCAEARLPARPPARHSVTASDATVRVRVIPISLSEVVAQ